MYDEDNMIAPTCPRCKIEMSVGIAINPTDPDFLRNALRGPTVPINSNDIRLDRVWKCSKCGYSNDLL